MGLDLSQHGESGYHMEQEGTMLPADPSEPVDGRGSIHRRSHGARQAGTRLIENAECRMSNAEWKASILHSTFCILHFLKKSQRSAL